MKEDEHGEPQTPQHHLLHPLHIQHAEDEDELVEDEVPELIFHMLSDREEHKSRLTSRYHYYSGNLAIYPLHVEHVKFTGTYKNVHY